MKLLQQWWLSLRPFSFPASLIPSVLGLVMAAKTKPLDSIGALLALVTSLTLHIVANLYNSFYDWQLGHDQSGDRQVVPLLLSGKHGPRILWGYGLAFLLLALILIIILGLNYNPLVMLIALFGLFSAYFYTAPPLMYKKRGLGLAVVFFTMGILIPVNSYLIQTKSLTGRIIFASIPLALLVTAILQGNELRDYHSDMRHNINSFTAVFGLKMGIKLYLFLIAAPYFTILALYLAESLPLLSLSTLLTSRFALTLARKADQHEFFGLDSETAKLYTAFGALYILSLAVSR
ncbi:MAG: prenyltransferase [Firmicutes bacterium]|nr:prenyltransferase [Bacillota bacterium]